MSEPTTAELAQEVRQEACQRGDYDDDCAACRAADRLEAHEQEREQWNFACLEYNQQIEDLQMALKLAQTALEQAEWVDSYVGRNWVMCPNCEATFDQNNDMRQHAEDCARQQALAAIKKVVE